MAYVALNAINVKDVLISVDIRLNILLDCPSSSTICLSLLLVFRVLTVLLITFAFVLFVSVIPIPKSDGICVSTGLTVNLIVIMVSLIPNSSTTNVSDDRWILHKNILALFLFFPVTAYSGVMEFDSPYQSFEYMAKMEKHFREKIAKEIEDLIDPPPIDEVDYIIVNVIEKCASVARGNTSPR